MAFIIALQQPAAKLASQTSFVKLPHIEQFTSKTFFQNIIHPAYPAAGSESAYPVYF